MKLAAAGVAISLAMAAQPAQAAQAPAYGFEVVHAYPHDPKAYTEGLLYLNGFLYESTGQYGTSYIRKVKLETGAVVRQVTLPPSLFGEGIVNFADQLISVTWKNGIGFRRDLKTFAVKQQFRYSGEGWGMTQDGKDIILSDGSPVLHVLDPKSLKEVRQIRVASGDQPIANLNELEWVDGEIYANVWQTNYIARIDPGTGQVKAWIDLSGLPETSEPHDPDNVLNGIAYDKTGHRLFVTGKRWPHLYEIKLKPKTAG
ncbi:glutaminyl-peptide cyclotransferase [Phenylobacterium montanum]|nr:glutaminyl-peptide cyclotransferase [Caulobacter sp. S6]